MSIFVRDTIFLRAAIGTLLSAAAAQSPPPPDFCSSPAACYTPARGPNCPQVRFGWGDCPGSRQACDWCYGPNGVFAYTPRGSTYTLNSGCNQFGNNATWTTKDAQIAQWMSQAGGNCVSDGRGGYTCSNVDAGRFKQAANCGSTGTPPAPAQAPAQAPAPTPTASSGNNPGPCSNPAACYTPARGPNCPRVRFGWGDCPGSRQACDWCYGPDGGVFAYTPRGSVYTLESGCNQFGSNTTWATKDPLVAQSMSNAGGNCSSDGQGGYACSNVDAGRYKQAANCGGGCWTNLPEGKLCTQGKYFKDRNGRTVLLRGVNLAGTSKIPPFLALPKKGGVMGFVLNNGVMNTASFDFIGNSDFSELDPLPAWGLNVIRLLFVWEAYEPVQGTGSQRYLDYLSRIVDEAWSRGIYTIIDFHQDAYARFLAGGCGEGFPQWSIPPGITLDKPVNDASCANWMLKAFGFDYIRFWKDLTSGNWNDLFAGQFDPRVHSAFHDFYADTNGVRSHYRQVMANLASTFSGKKGAIGYDVLNEPFSDPLESELTSLYGDVANDIRQGDPYALLFLEPNLLTDTGKLTLVKPPSGVPGVVYAPHFYDPDSHGEKAIHLSPADHRRLQDNGGASRLLERTSVRGRVWRVGGRLRSRELYRHDSQTVQRRYSVLGSVVLHAGLDEGRQRRLEWGRFEHRGRPTELPRQSLPSAAATAGDQRRAAKPHRGCGEFLGHLGAALDQQSRRSAQLDPDCHLCAQLPRYHYRQHHPHGGFRKPAGVPKRWNSPHRL
ncbi:exported hypothetical protein [Candidatus Sulfopaludibacter sp. SbA6]|nr:exported hypothetical protein [Candidatus Sulfopaludibacter sp. SbA6]